MVYTISFNSSIDYTFYLSRVRYDDINRIEEERVDAGGKGLNVARMLTVLGCCCEALTFLGGSNGNTLKTLLDNENVRYRYVPAKGNVRNIFNFFDSEKNRVLRFNEKGPQVSRKEEAAFFRLLKDTRLKKGDVVSISGSIPPGMNKNVYKNIIEEVRGRGIFTVLDADGEVLKKGINGKPDVIKPNLWELERASGTKITSLKILEKVLRNLMDKGVSEVLLTLGERGAVLFSEDEFLYARAPSVKILSTIGCGDTFLAGFLYCFSRGETSERSLRTAVACGTAKAAVKGTEMPDRNDVMRIYPKVKVFRMNDLPTSFRMGLLRKA
jgi:1-phosphofructokinase family hexose kinase